jgi:tail assembly chaperone
MSIVPETELMIGSNRYRVSRMSVFEQFDVAADYRDILIGLSFVKRDRPPDMNQSDYDSAVQFIMSSRASLTPEIRTRVINTCLKYVARSGGGAVGWAPVLAASQTLQFDDIDMPTIIKLMYAVFEHNKLIDFFSASPSSSGEQTTEKTGQPSPEAKVG